MAKRDHYCEDILSGNREVDRLYEDEKVLAFHHPFPISQIHVVVIPKQHIESVLSAEAKDGELLASMVTAIQEVANSLGLSDGGLFVRANAAAPGVTPHMHWHVVGPGVDAEWPKPDPSSVNRDVPAS